MPYKTKILTFGVLLGILPLLGATCGGDPVDAGILRSHDGAVTFEYANFIDEDNTVGDKNVLSILINSKNPDQIIIGTEGNGFFFTENKGNNWAAIPLGGGSGFSAALDPTNSEIIYFGIDRRIFRTSDGGRSFTKIYVDQSSNIRGILVDPLENDTIYAIVDNGRFIATTDAGENWEARKHIFGVVPNELIMDPEDPQRIYMSTANHGVYFTKDGGYTFKNPGEPTLRTFEDKAVAIRDIDINPFNTEQLLAATSFGLFVSNDKSLTWELVNTIVPPGSTELQSCVYHPSVEDAIFFGAANKMYISQDLGKSWAVVALPTSRGVNQIAIDPENVNAIYLGIYGTPPEKEPLQLIKFGD